MHAAVRELNQRYWLTLLASELSKTVFRESAFISNSVTFVKEGNRLSGKASFTLLEWFFQLNAQARLILRFLDSFSSLNSVHFL